MGQRGQTSVMCTCVYIHARSHFTGGMPQKGVGGTHLSHLTPVGFGGGVSYIALLPLLLPGSWQGLRSALPPDSGVQTLYMIPQVPSGRQGEGCACRRDPETQRPKLRQQQVIPSLLGSCSADPLYLVRTSLFQPCCKEGEHVWGGGRVPQ